MVPGARAPTAGLEAALGYERHSICGSLPKYTGGGGGGQRRACSSPIALQWSLVAGSRDGARKGALPGPQAPQPPTHCPALGPILCLPPWSPVLEGASGRIRRPVSGTGTETSHPWELPVRLADQAWEGMLPRGSAEDVGFHPQNPIGPMENDHRQ